MPQQPNRRPPVRKKSPFAAKSNWEWDWHWRSIAAVVYFIILLFDFVAMPLYREITYNKLTIPQMVKMSQEMDPTAQVETLRILKEDRAWTPLTNDMVHLAFGAILGVSALPQNRRRKRRWGGGYDDYDGYGDNEEYGNDDPYNQNDQYSRYGGGRSGSANPHDPTYVPTPPSKDEPEVLE